MNRLALVLSVYALIALTAIWSDIKINENNMNLALQKFIKAFITGGLVAISAALGMGISVHSLEEAKHALIVLGLAFFSGGVHAAWELKYPTAPLPS